VSHLNKRWLLTITLIGLPLMLYIFIAEHVSWLPHTLYTSSGSVTALAFSAEGQMLAVGTTAAVHQRFTGEIQIWNVQTRTLSKIIVSPSGRHSSLAFAPNGLVLGWRNQLEGDAIVGCQEW
jgi:WD40 repeat protein